MKNMLKTKKAITLFMVFVFLLSNFNLASAAAPTITTLESNQANINGSNETNLSFNLKGITDTDTSDTMSYSYSWDGINYSNLNVNSTQREYTASEDLNRGDAVYKLPEFSTSLLQEYTNTNLVGGYGESSLTYSSYTILPFDFTTSPDHEKLEKISFYMLRGWNYSGNLKFNIREKGTYQTVASTTISHNSIIPFDTWTWFDISFDTILSPNTQYEILIENDLPASIRIGAGSPDGGNTIITSNKVYESKATGFGANAIGKATAIDTIKSEFIGFANSDITAGNNVLVDVAGESTTQELLGSGSTYYLSDTLGEISTIPGTISKTIGTAISDTTIDLVNNYYDNAQVNFNINASTQADGNLTLYVKTNDGTSDSNVLSLDITKNSIAPIITITEPIIDSATQTISATTDKGILYYSETTGDTCNNTLNFSLYTESVFNLNSDNGKKVCYRSIDNAGNNTHKLSTKVWGIAKESYMGGDIFYGFQNWYNSPYSKSNDSQLAVLKLMASYVKSSSESTSYPSSFIDINGDGLVDMLYIDERVWTGFESDIMNDPIWTGGSNSPSNVTSVYYYKYAILINNGDMTFNSLYRCEIIKQPSSKIYYGDCAE